MQNMHFASSDKPVNPLSLDVIISVDYLLKSLRGTQFLIWANLYTIELNIVKAPS